MNRVEFEEAVGMMAREFKDRGYSLSTTGKFAQFCRTVSLRLPLEGEGPDVVKMLLAYVDGMDGEGFSESRKETVRRFARYIISHVETGEIDFTIPKRRTRPEIGGEFDMELGRYKESLRRRGLKESSVAARSRCARRFLAHLYGRGLVSLSEAKASDVADYVARISPLHAGSGLLGELCMLRSLLRFSDDAGLTANAQYWVPRGRDLRPAKVAPLDDEEVAAVVLSIDNSTAVGKRDLAIVLMAARTGARSSEIAGLELGDIDWNQRSLTVNRVKTCTVSVLPMDDVLAASLADYILNGRPESACSSVFLSHKAPYGPLGASGMTHVSERRYADAGVAGRAGLHRLRHTAATDMLRSGVAPDAMAAVLGHARVESTMVYAAIDEAGLRRCCLALPKGGQR